MSTVFTRKDYLAAPYEEQRAAHRRYYAQFVTPSVKGFVASVIGRDRILASTDPHFNDIPLTQWDALNPAIRDMCLSRKGDIDGAISADKFGRRSIGWSLSDAVCIAKEAAQQIREEAQARAE